MDFAQEQRNPGKHVVGFGIVLALHLLLGWALVNGLGKRLIEVIKAPIETKIIEEVKPPPPPPPDNLPPPKFAPPPPSFVPPPEVHVNAPASFAPTITTTHVAPPPTLVYVAPAPAPARVVAPPAPARVAAQPAIANVHACAPTNDDYPTAAKRAEATGITKVRFQIGPDGKLASAEVVRSAGPSREHKMLDRLAVSKLSECNFKPGRDENGRPIGGSFDVEYVWKLVD